MTPRSRQSTLRWGLLALALVLAGAADARAQVTLTVNSTDDVDDGTCDVTHCSLREAINAANGTPAADTIAFNLTPGVVSTITTLSELPQITRPLTIDGYTQPGAVANTNATGGLNAIPLIEITAPGAPNQTHGLDINASDVTIKGLIIGGYYYYAIYLEPGASRVTIAGNFIGTVADGTGASSASVTRRGITVQSAGADIMIGGSTAADRNLISGNGTGGIGIFRDLWVPTGIQIQGNLIGTDRTGTTAVANVVGIFTSAGSQADTITIGGSTAELGNVISGNTYHGINIDNDAYEDPSGTSITIEHNLIGTSADSFTALGNLQSGVLINGAVKAMVRRNTVGFSGTNGIAVTGSGLTSYGAGVTITENSLFANTGPGIDLGNDGRTVNDADDSDNGPNALLNYPTVISAVYDAGTPTLAVLGFAQLAPNRTYTIELFQNLDGLTSGHDAARYLTTTSLNTDMAGYGEFTANINGTFTPGDAISATVTDPDGYTSEISDFRTIVPPGHTISGTVKLQNGTPVAGVNIDLSANGTWIQDMTSDNAGAYTFTGLPPADYVITPSMEGITFAPTSRSVNNLTTDYVADFTATPFPVTYTVNTADDNDDGTCNVSHCSLREAINAANVHPGPDTIAFSIAPFGAVHTIDTAVNGDLPQIQGALLLDGFTQPGASPNTNATGGLNTVLKIALHGGGNTGLVINSNDVTVRGLAIGGYLHDIGLGISARTNVTIAGNFLGTTPDGLTRAGSDVGIEGSLRTSVTIGGSTPASRNLISGHTLFGISVLQGNGVSSTQRIQGNLIGTNATGQQALGNWTGIAYDVIAGASVVEDMLIGGTAAERNVISGNGGPGISVGRLTTYDTDPVIREIANNYVGVAADGVTALGNGESGITVDGRVSLIVRNNIVANNNGAGVALTTHIPPNGRGVAMTSNSIYANTGLAIDLDTDGRTANDVDDMDTGSNSLQNFPVLTSATALLAGGATISGQLVTLNNRTYIIQAFATGGSNAAGMNAKTFIGEKTVTTNDDGLATFTFAVTTVAPGEFIVTTATEIPYGRTSEVSDAIAVAPVVRHGISGTITWDAQALPGVTVSLSGTMTASTMTDAAGQYAFANVPAEGTYVITPSLEGYAFTPPNAHVANLQGDVTADFAATVTDTLQYLAEGATGSFWQTSIGILNPSGKPVTAAVDFLMDNGVSKQISVPIAGPGHVVIDPSTIEGLEQATFSTVVRAAAPIVAGRTMRWGNNGELGAHAEQAVSAPRDTWYFAEGATSCFKLFYLLVNPNDQAADVTITYARRAPEAPVVLTYTVPAFSRYTVPVNDQPGLKFAEVAGKIEVTNHVPIVAERSMYSSCYGASWRGGHDSVGSPAPSTTWYLAEGATGSFFDFYLLAANFESDDATIEVRYLLADGTSFTKPHIVPAHSRLTIDIAGEDARLASTSVGAVITSTNAVPVVVERSQWWPHGHWYEGHASAGATQAGIEWHLADAEAGGTRKSHAYLLIANTSAAAGAAQVRLVFDDGTTAQLPAPMPLAGYERKTLDLGDVFPAAIGKRFGVIVESFGATPSPIVVELSIYNNTTLNGADVFWGNGTNVVATRVR